ncbi:MAG: hypothetical protein U0T83_11315 [Bacteriovoracaceae bacterium]
MDSQFFITVGPGLETLALSELESKWKTLYPTIEFPVCKIVKGGINLTCDYSLGVSLNYFLKIPTRILLRIDEFKARDFPKLYNKIRKFNWRPYLKNENFELKVTCHKSRLNLTKKIEKTIRDGISTYFKAQPAKKKDLEFKHKTIELTLHFLFDNDNCLISIDTSGYQLNKRGYKTFNSEASIRETYASAMNLKLEQLLKKESLPTLPYLIDPMAGSGTLLFESALFNFINPKQEFAFQFFNLKSNFDIASLSLTQKPIYAGFQGSDQDEKNIKACESNLANIEKLTSIAPMSFKVLDLFKLKKTDLPSRELVFIFNPPYGKRLALGENFDPRFYQKTLEYIMKHFTPLFIGILVPTEANLHQLKLKTDHKFNLIDRLNFKNGAIPVTFYVWKKA